MNSNAIAMTKTELTEAYAVCLELANWAMNEMRRSIDHSGIARTKHDAADWVTDVDLRIEEHVRQTITRRFPNHVITGEEFGTSGREGSLLTWYVDPIDGTCNYRHGIRWNSFSLALCHEGEPVAGVVADPYRAEMFHACRGLGAFINDRAVQLSGETPILSGQIVMLELANHLYWRGMTSCLSRLSEQLVTARIMGSSALSVAHAGAGRAVGAILGGSNPIDVAASVLFARESGAVVMGRDGDSEIFPKDGLVVGHPGVVEELWQLAFASEQKR